MFPILNPVPLLAKRVCPAGIAIQKYLSLAAQNKLPEAIADMQAANPFPAVTGHFCDAPCERVCNRKKWDRPVSLREIERILAVKLAVAPLPCPRSDSGKRVAVIGAGLAGLTASWFLSWLGHNVTLFEAKSKPGERILEMAGDNLEIIRPIESAIARILAMGPDFRPGVILGRDILLSGLRDEFAAVLVSTGVPDSDSNLGLSVNAFGRPEIDPETHAVSIPGVFAAGELVTGRVSTAETISAGRVAAVSIDAYLRGSNLHNVRTVLVDSNGKIRIEEFRSAPISGKRYVVGFEELRNMDYFEQAANDSHPPTGEGAAEARRCLHCGHCIGCGTCADVCPGDVLTMEDGKPKLAYPEECIHCGACLVDCPTGAISFHVPLPMTIAPCPQEPRLR